MAPAEPGSGRSGAGSTAGAAALARIRVLCALLAALAACDTDAAELLSALFSRHMVMQRGAAVPVWGWAGSRETVTVTIGGQTKVATADENGKWMVRLDPMQPGAPRTMTVKAGTRTEEVGDILLGEVWVASGQSNMAWPLKHAQDGATEIASASYPRVRFFNVASGVSPRGPSDHLPAPHPAKPDENVWTAVSPATAGNFSAVAYFFARNLHRALDNVPVGIVVNAVNGSPIEAWISREAYRRDPDLKAIADYYDGLAHYIESTPSGRKEAADVAAEYDARQAKLRASGKAPMWPTKYRPPTALPGFGSTLYNAMVHPLAPYAMRGVIWYQGEAQGRRGQEYRDLLRLLITDWRRQWGQGNFPFVYAQLPNWARANPEPENSEWALIREAQLLALKLPETAMAVTIDIGEAANLHPGNKRDVGDRLALAARGMAYGSATEYSGPIYRAMKVEGQAIRISFDHVGAGLMVGRKTGYGPAVDDKGARLAHFAIAGEDMKFTWADARIDGDTVVVSSPAVTRPVAVRYAWATNPAGSNLYNRDGLPASPFRTDESRPRTAGAHFRSLIEKGYSLRRSN